MPLKARAVLSELLCLFFLCVAVLGERAHHGQLAFHFWFWEERWRLGLHVLLCGEWLPPSSALSGDQVDENVLPFPAGAAPVLFTARSLTLCFVFREGAIDRLVNIYKNVVHKTGVRVFPFPWKMPGSLPPKGLYFNSALLWPAGLPHWEWVCEPAAGPDDHAGCWGSWRQHFQKEERRRCNFFVLVLTFLEFGFNHLLLARDTPLRE